MQSQLRASAITGANSIRFGSTQHAVKALLQSRENSTLRCASRVTSAHLSRNGLLRKNIAPATRALAAPKFVAAQLQKAPTQLLRAWRRRSAYRADVRRFGFLYKGRVSARDARYTAAAVSAKSALRFEQRRYRELQIYHDRPRMRLPETAVTRRRRRKAGLVHFARNSLKRPRTLLGQQYLLLPPAAAYARAITAQRVGYVPGPGVLAAYKRQADLLPVF